MSGGYFEYKQYQLNELTDLLTNALNIELHELDRTTDEDFVKALIKYSIKALEEQSIILNRLDWFLSGDDNFEKFKKKLIEELQNYITITNFK